MVKLRHLLPLLLLLAFPAHAGGPDPMTRAEIQSNAQSGVGYSYWWGRGRWRRDALRSPGSCSGSCPSCSHCASGTRNGSCSSTRRERGADCSGFVAKAWQVPEAVAFDSNSHPYSTLHFTCTETHWQHRSRSAVRLGDAASYRSGGCPGSSGHVLLYHRGDPWGYWTTWEARGCSYGIVHPAGRSVSGYTVSRRNGLVLPDADDDGISDSTDNCVDTPNPGQADADGDDIGNLCDNCVQAANAGQADGDGDGIGNVCDNCPDIDNPAQNDHDADSAGDPCDADDDNDGLVDTSDNCPRVANPAQADTDLDLIGNACEDDDDGDGVNDTDDNCVHIANADQIDADGDGFGSACDNCPGVANPAQEDTNQDGVGDFCELPADSDLDEIPDVLDNCPLAPNPEQLDGDGDGEGDACEADADADGDPDDLDNCRNAPNPAQEDEDEDGVGDACDNCPGVWNADQADSDGEGTGDACDDLEGEDDAVPTEDDDSAAWYGDDDSSLVDDDSAPSGDDDTTPVPGVFEEDEDGPPMSNEGCGCSSDARSGPNPQHAAGMLLAIGVCLRRRRHGDHGPPRTP